MAAPLSVEELIELVRKSGVVDEQKLECYIAARESKGGLPLHARACADELVRDGILTSFQSDQLMQGKWRGFTIGKYKLLERIGVGGMGQVFLGEHSTLKNRVALKVLPPTKADQPSALGRFYREARAAAAIEHPNVVRTHDIDQDGELHFIVMDYVEGTNLLELVKKFGPLEVKRAISYVHQVALGLDAAFRNGIIHRDLKPGNIMIDRQGVARLLDLGLARFFADNTDILTLKYDEKSVLGTADYVAPEQVVNSHDADTRADIYALGATFYFLLAGHPPFPNGTVSQKLLWHRTKEPAPIDEMRADVPPGLIALIGKMMAKEPKKRFQSPAQVAAELSKWVSRSVPLPGPEEMPQLSPAARDGADGMNPGPTSPQRDNSRMSGATALLHPPNPSKQPAWAANAAEIDTDDTMQRTPGSSSRMHFEAPNPFSRGDLTNSQTPTAAAGSRPIPWALVGAIVAAILAVAVLLAGRN